MFKIFNKYNTVEITKFLASKFTYWDNKKYFKKYNDLKLIINVVPGIGKTFLCAQTSHPKILVWHQIYDLISGKNILIQEHIIWKSKNNSLTKLGKETISFRSDCSMYFHRQFDFLFNLRGLELKLSFPHKDF